MNANASDVVDVAVIGAGIAGLSAAHTLHRAGIDVVVLEASERVGGRTRNRRLADGALVELGGAWLGPGHTRTRALADAYGLDRFASYGSGVGRFETLSGDVVPFTGALPSSNEASARALENALSTLDGLADQVDVRQPWATPDATHYDSQTFGQWIDDNVSDPEAHAVLRLICEAVLAVDPSDVSLLHLLFYGRASGGLRGLIAIEGGAQDERLVEGTEAISRSIAAELGPRIRLDARVDRIAQRDNHVRVSTSSLEVQARAAIVAVAPHVAARVQYEPALPAQRETLLRTVRPGSAMKCVVVYDKPFWRDQGLSGHGRSLIGPAKGFFDVTPASGSPGMILGFVEGSQGRWMANQPIGARYDSACASVARLLGPKTPEPRDYVDHDYSGYPNIGGCYAGYFPPGAWTEHRPNMREPIGRLHWAGTETAAEWYGYIEGAVRSGERAAAEVAAALV